MPAQNKPIILVDGSSYLYRAFHALPALANSKSFPTGAIYGVVNMLKRLMADYQPEYMAVIFDAKGKTFRDEIYAEYKATRQEMPGDLARQIEPIHKIIRAMGISLIMIEGVEADDVIGTLVQHAQKKGEQVIISTGDKDFAQLVNTHVTLINTMSNTTLDPLSVKEKFGVPPERIVDYLTLVGDSSDNIPGVPQVGPKTAAKWLQEYGSLDKIVANADKISGKVGESLRASLNQIPLTKSLVSIKLDVDLPIEYSDLKLKAPSKQELISLYKEMEFKSWLAELLKETEEVTTDKYSHYDIIYAEKQFNDFLKKLSAATTICLDLQTSNPSDLINGHLVGISFSIEPGKAVYIPVGHDYAGAPIQLADKNILEKLKPILENPDIKKIGKNLKFCIEVLTRYDVNLQGIAYDTMMESYVLDSSSNKHDVDSLALKYLGLRTIEYAEIAGSGSKQIPFNQIEIHKAAVFAGENADITLRLHEQLSAKIKKEKGLAHIFSEIEMPLVSVLARMEHIGVLIDTKKLSAQEKELKKKLDELQAQAFTLAQCEFNMNSPKQLQEILFQKLKLPVLQKTPTGQASTADAVLQELALDFELPRIIIEYRSLSKLLSTYICSLPEQINPTTGRVHTSYNQTGAATGRLSSSDPNLQNIPIRSVEGRKIRQAFVAPKGNKIISADYSQIELRLMAHISEDKNLLYAFANNLDIHQATAAEVWQVSIEKVTSDMRRNAKAINFGLIYGMSAFGLTRQLGIERKAAQEYIDRYFERYPSVKLYMENTREKARAAGYVETLWGRRVYLPEINASQIPRQKAAERAAINGPLQGSAADIIKMAMIRIDKWLQEEKPPVKMIMQVHDELVFEVDEKHVEEISKKIQNYMSQVVQLKVPLVVSVGIGDNWDTASNH